MNFKMILFYKFISCIQRLNTSLSERFFCSLTVVSFISFFLLRLSSSNNITENENILGLF